MMILKATAGLHECIIYSYPFRKRAQLSLKKHFHKYEPYSRHKRNFLTSLQLLEQKQTHGRKESLLLLVLVMFWCNMSSH